MFVMQWQKGRKPGGNNVHETERGLLIHGRERMKGGVGNRRG